MSTEARPTPSRTLRVATGSAPSAASLAEGGTEQALGRLLERREAEGYARGLAEGRRALSEELGAAFTGALERLDKSREAALEQLNHTSVELAVEIARKLLRAEIPAGRYDLEGIVRSTLAFSDTGRGQCVVHVNPADAERLSEVPFRAGTEVEPDPSVPQGSVHVTTPQGLLVRDLDEALSSIGERILEGLE